ncbi:GH12 family glycosyl hydrolase domain-containing protein [Actinocorallia longicatena]|uniref:Glycosyl hydrolase family 12 n=1 Tax=Actinocorallia longicatena TaxID=111803 RepID=A0ABP6QK76_9ACTN
MRRVGGCIAAALLLSAVLLLGTVPAAGARAEERCNTGEPGFVAGGYAVQANRWNSRADLCVTFGGDPAFTVSRSTLAWDSLSNGAPPGAYPNIGTSLADRRFPRGIDSPLSTTWEFRKAEGDYNASYDLWYHPDEAACRSTAPHIVANPGALEIMIWLASPGIDPAPSWKIADGVTVAGRLYDLYKFQGPTGQVGLIYDLRTETTKITGFDLVPFARDAVRRGFQKTEASLCKVQAGFEITRAGQGLATTAFALDDTALDDTASAATPAPAPTAATTPPSPEGGGGPSPWWALPVIALTTAAGVLLWRRRR